MVRLRYTQKTTFIQLYLQTHPKFTIRPRRSSFSLFVVAQWVVYGYKIFLAIFPDYLLVYTLPSTTISTNHPLTVVKRRENAHYKILAIYGMLTN